MASLPIAGGRAAGAVRADARLRSRTIAALLIAALLAAQPVVAQERVPEQEPSVLRDTETEALLADMARPLGIGAGLPPGSPKIVLLQAPEINAFVAGGQIVYLHSGLFVAADSANEVQGVIAHEIGHIIGGHISLAAEHAAPATRISILSLLAGLAAVAAGAGSAGMAAIMAGQQAAVGKYLAFSRTQEASADASAVTTLAAAHVTGKGMVSFFEKLKREEYRLSSSYMATDPFAQTHPMSADRQQILLGALSVSRWWNVPPDPAIETRFQRVKAKLIGYIDDPDVVLRRYPETDQSVPARYARAYAWHRAAYPDKANAEIDSLVRQYPHDPYILELKGQILLESGKPLLAVPPLREAVTQSRNAPLIAALLGHALIETEDRANFNEARAILKVSVARDEDNPFAWYQLGIVYEREGDEPHAALATAERYSLEGESRLALGSAQLAMGGLAEGSPDYIRAQDIALASRNAVEDEKGKKHR